MNSKFIIEKAPKYGNIDKILSKEELKKTYLSNVALDLSERAAMKFFKKWIQDVGERWWIIVGEI